MKTIPDLISDFRMILKKVLDIYYKFFEHFGSKMNVYGWNGRWKTEIRAQGIMKRDDAIYLAGLFDGEGCVQFHRRYKGKKGKVGKRYNCLTCTLDIAMTDKETIEHVKKITGLGSVNLRVT